MLFALPPNYNCTSKCAKGSSSSQVLSLHLSLRDYTRHGRSIRVYMYSNNRMHTRQHSAFPRTCTMRVERIGHFESCMTDYMYIMCAHVHGRFNPYPPVISADRLCIPESYQLECSPQRPLRRLSSIGTNMYDDAQASEYSK